MGKKYRNIAIDEEVFWIIRACAKYFNTTHSDFLGMVFQFAYLIETGDFKESSKKAFREHIDYYEKYGHRSPALQQFLDLSNF